MNYQHGFHAGNFADVIKHIVLMRALAHLAAKPAPFRIIDTHAGAGLYDLSGAMAARTGEWQGGIGRLTDPFPEAVEAILAPYRAALLALSPDGRLYPGSPALIRHALRGEDRAYLAELHPETGAQLRRHLGRDPRLTIGEMDGYRAWKAQIPPPERRGLVLVDPPFEIPGEFTRILAGLAIMARKWPRGMAAIWYPIKDKAALASFEAALPAFGFARISLLDLAIDRVLPEGPLRACGMAMINAPFTLADELEILLPALAHRLALSPEAYGRLKRLREG